MYDVVIIGAGVVGALTARALCRYRLNVCLLERENDVACGATKANSAIVHAGFDALPGTLKAELNVRGSAMMEQVTQELGVKYKRNGSLVLALNDEELETLKELLARGEKNGVPGLRLLDAEELHRMEPALSDEVRYALYAPTGAIVCPYELAISAAGNAMDNGCVLRTGFTVRRIENTGDSYRISDGQETVEARYIINCAGSFSDEIAALAGAPSFRIIPRRGEYLLLDQQAGGLVSHTLFRTPSKMGKGILISPTVDGNLLLGPTSEDIESKTDKQTTAAGLDKISASVSQTLREPPLRLVITSFCGLRSTTEGEDFIIDRPLPHFINAAGIDSPGLSASPAIAERIVTLLREAGMELTENPDFSPYREPTHRFRNMSNEEKTAFIKRHPEYGRYVCRCESVSEGEILDAIRRNPPARDLDAVKRRTRSGMGRCQGGFCSPTVAHLLAQELGIPFEDVTKCGGASVINLERTK